MYYANKEMSEAVGFEPTRRASPRLAAYKAAAIGQAMRRLRIRNRRPCRANLAGRLFLYDGLKHK
jgi:methylphosphotriester-DNA--protein-cysteine methyltransferase